VTLQGSLAFAPGKGAPEESQLVHRGCVQLKGKARGRRGDGEASRRHPGVIVARRREAA
jgi:hypothetical protein